MSWSARDDMGEFFEEGLSSDCKDAITVDYIRSILETIPDIKSKSTEVGEKVFAQYSFNEDFFERIRTSLNKVFAKNIKRRVMDSLDDDRYYHINCLEDCNFRKEICDLLRPKEKIFVDLINEHITRLYKEYRDTYNNL